MRVLFGYHELWDVVESGVSALAANATEAQRVAHSDQKEKDNKTLYLIHQGMNDETFEQIEGETTASEAWTILLTNYKGDDKIKRVRLQTLRRQYGLLQMETTETIDVYINKVIALTNQMKSNGETHSEQAKQRMNDNNIEKPIEQALQAQASIGSSYHKHGSSRGRGQGHGGSYSSKGRGGQNHGGAEQNNTGSNHIPSSNNSWRRERGREGRGDIYNKSNVECYNCHKCDHYANECRSKGDNHAVNCAQEDSNHVQDEEDHTILMTATSKQSDLVFGYRLHESYVWSEGAVCGFG
ncbi:uncharacterized protein [Phaseolus vulgaris]|uniref:uncharacterized protein n=1 Tax=Phaseolus vulgaris TaxID=3885 RepID=UPI0035CA179A